MSISYVNLIKIQKWYDIETLTNPARNHTSITFSLTFIKTAASWDYSMPAAIYVQFNSEYQKPHELQLPCEQLGKTIL